MSEDLREQLRRMASTVAPPDARPAWVEQRARRRLARNLLTILVTVSLVSGGSALAWRSVASPRGLVDPASGAGVYVESSATTEDGTQRCTARVPAVLHPGIPIGATATIENLSSKPFEEYDHLYAVLEIADPHGRLVRKDYERVFGYGHGPPSRVTLRPRKPREILLYGGDDMVRWDGRLEVRITCQTLSGPRLPLPPLATRVEPPPDTPSAGDAVGRALGVRPGLLDRCVPKPDGTWTHGELTPPPTWADEDGKPHPSQELPPLTARCSVAVTKHDGFVEVEVRVLAPSAAPDFPFSDQPVGHFVWFTRGPPGGVPLEVMRWRIVVTAEREFDSGLTEQAHWGTRSPDAGLIPDLDWFEGSWHLDRGSDLCGSHGGGFRWVSLCGDD